MAILTAVTPISMEETTSSAVYDCPVWFGDNKRGKQSTLDHMTVLRT